MEPQGNGGSAEPGLPEVLSAYLEAERKGHAPRPTELLRRYPHLADGLAEFFDQRDQFEGPDGAPGRRTKYPGTATLPVAEASAEQLTTDLVCHFGDYELLDEIARGGMGVVYRARQISLNRIVALKTIGAGRLASRADVARFYTEAEAVAHLDHPHIVPIYEVGQHEGRHFFSMKFYDGGSLAQELARFAKDHRAAARLLATVARAVHYAHQRGILHRDLKPANVLLDAEDRPHLVDFGVAQRVESSEVLDTEGLIAGTPSYMAPEQARGQASSITTAADVYSLGAILYELLTGKPPFAGGRPAETLVQVVAREPERPRSVNRRCDPGLELICLKCLEKDPQRRYGSAEALADDLERWLNAEPISVRPPSLASLLRLWLRQNFGAAWWAAAIGLASGVLLGVAFWFSSIRTLLRIYGQAYTRLPNLDAPWLALIQRLPPALGEFLPWFQVAWFSTLGLLTVLLVRPRSRTAEAAAGLITGLVAAVAAFAVSLGWWGVVTTVFRPPVTMELRLLSRAAVQPGEESHVVGRPGEAADLLAGSYPELARIPLPERGWVLHHKTVYDIIARVPAGIWLGLFLSLGLCETICVAETLAAGALLRRYGNARAVLRPYLEFAVPGALLSFLIFMHAQVYIVSGLSFAEFLAQYWYDHFGSLYGPGRAAGAGAYAESTLSLALPFLLALTVTSVLRGWRGSVRTLLHLAWLLTVLTILHVLPVITP